MLDPATIRPQRAATLAAALLALWALVSPADARAERALVVYATPPGDAQRAALRRHNARLVRLWDRHAWAALVDLPDAAQGAALMRDDPTVRAVVPDFGGAGASPEALRSTGAWGLGAPVSGRVALRGDGQTVAVLDTGIDADHPDLRGRVVRWIDLIDPAQTTPYDPHGHGTAVAGLIVGSGAAWRDGAVALTLTAPPGLWSTPERAPTLPVWPQDAPPHTTRVRLRVAPHTRAGSATLRDGDRPTLRVRCAPECVFAALAPSPQPRRVALSLSPNTSSAPRALQATLPFRHTTARDDSRSPFAGTAPRARLVALRVLDASNRLPSSATLLDALVWLGDHGAALGVGVINLSLALDRDGPNAAVDDALNRVAASLGASVVVAAPNGRPLASPATASSALVVTALDHDAQLAPYAAPHARLGPGLIAAPGGTQRAPLVLTDSDHARCKPLLSAAPCAHTSDPFPDDATLGFGTSFAAAQVSGVLALLREAAQQRAVTPNTPDALRVILRATAAPGDTPDAPRRLNARSARDALRTTWRASQQRAQGTLGPALYARTWARRLSAAPSGATSAPLRVTYSDGVIGQAHLYAAAPDAAGGLQRIASLTGDGLLRFPNGRGGSDAMLVVERHDGAGTFTVERAQTSPPTPAPQRGATPPPTPRAEQSCGCAVAPGERRGAVGWGWIALVCVVTASRRRLRLQTAGNLRLRARARCRRGCTRG